MKKEILTTVSDDGQILAVVVWDARVDWAAAYIPIDRVLELKEKLDAVVLEVFGRTDD